MAIEFEARHTDGFSRLGRLHTPHGVANTPAFLPVINPNIPLIPPAEMKRDFGVEILITNSYIVRSTESLRTRALDEGLHAVAGFDGPIMTDSGTFQSYVYGDVSVTPEDIVAFQRDIGTDIGTILDIFSTPDRDHAQASDDLERTVERARAAPAIAGDMALALTVQGGVHEDLRTRAATLLRDVEHVGGAVHPIGGVVPIMENQDYALLARVILAAQRGIHKGRAVHLFGAGHPHVIPMAVLLGCDLFDSSAYAKFAKDGRLLFAHGTVDLASAEELPCACAVCRHHTAAELRKLPARERESALARHNLHVTMTEMRRVREAQRVGRLWELVIERAHVHPALHEALPVLAAHADELEREEPLSKDSALFLTPPWDLLRPELKRVRARVAERFVADGRPLVPRPETKRPFLVHDMDGRALVAAGAIPVYPSRAGPIPAGLDEAFPVAQAVDPPLDDATLAAFPADVQDAAKRWGTTVDAARTAEPRAGQDHALLEVRARAVAAYQFGPDAADALLDGELRIHASRRTGRIRTIHAGDEHVLSMRASDGLYTLKFAGARRIHAAKAAPWATVTVDTESASFNRQGRNVMARFVGTVHDDLRPGDEVIVVADDEVAAVGQAWMTPREMRDMDKGVAVRVREGADKPVKDD